MQASFDRYGLLISTKDEAAASAYREAVDCILSAWPGAAHALDLAIASDPEFALAHAARARLHAMYARGPEARASIAIAQILAATRGTERERSHVDVLSNVINGASARALTGALAHLEQWPRDAFIMFMLLGAFGLLAFSGRPDHDRARVDLCDTYSSDYGNDWWFLTYQGWAYTESGEVRLGRAISERAFSSRTKNANAVHGLAHAMFEDGSVSEADSLLRAWMPNYDPSGIQYGHLTWHWALLALEQQNPDHALMLFNSRFRPSVTQAAPMNVVTDGISLLWRLVMEGKRVPEAAWHEMADYPRKAFPAAGVAFADAHIGLLAAATGNDIELDRRVGELELRLSRGALAAGPVVAAICRAAQAFAGEDYRKCSSILAPMVNDIVRIGGSHAQREVFEDTLLVALIKCGELDQAHMMLDQRLHRRPSRQHELWLAQAYG